MHKRILAGLAAVCALCALLFLGLFFLLASPSAVNRIASAIEPYTGYRVHVDDISLSRYLRASVEGLEVKRLKGDDFYLAASSAEVDARLAMPMKIEVEKIVLTRPRFTFHMKKEKEEGNLFAALENLPPVRLLVITDGQLEVKTPDGEYRLPGMDLTVKRFSPRTGGELSLEGRVNLASGEMAGKGSVEANLSMTGFTPAPRGRGTVKLYLDSASFGPTSAEKTSMTSKIRIEGDAISFDGTRLAIQSVSSGTGSQRVEIRDLRVSADLSYDQKTSRFQVTSLQGASPGLGSLEGKGTGTAKPFSWTASLNATDVDLPRVFALTRPFLPEEYRSWTIKGRGALDMQTEGRMNGEAVWKADVALELKEGGFASADNLKAGEKITGKVELKLSSPDQEQKGRFSVTMNAGEGEFLWGRFYRDFKGESIMVSSSGSFTRDPFSLSSTGLVDFFDTGRYGFSTELSTGRWLFSLDAKNVSHSALFTLFIKDYMRQNYGVEDLDVRGESDFRVTAVAEGDRTEMEGMVQMRDAGFRMPSKALSLDGLQASLPFNLVYPPPDTPGPLGAPDGFVSFERADAGNISMGELRIPLLLSQNTFLVPVQIELPAFGGKVLLTRFRVDKLLSPEAKLDAGLAVEQIGLGALTEKVLPVAVNGTINGRLPSIISEGGEWKTRGKIVAQVFGGQVEVSNIFGRNLFSGGRFFGGDISFEGIDLEQATSKIGVGMMTGHIRGSISGFAMEYGQPSQFVLNLETDPTKKGPKTVSVEAIENLSVLGTGSGAVGIILNSGINRFFKEYPYSRIGIACTLENDVFRLRGTIREGDKEYLIRRAFLRGIDVVNQNPDNKISFKDMQERVGRIFQKREEGPSIS